MTLPPLKNIPLMPLIFYVKSQNINKNLNFKHFWIIFFFLNFDLLSALNIRFERVKTHQSKCWCWFGFDKKSNTFWTKIICCYMLLPENSLYLDHRMSKLKLHPLTAHNWQKWKRVFLTCPCHKFFRNEAVGQKSCKNTWKITIFVKMWNLGQYRENLIFCQ